MKCKACDNEGKKELGQEWLCDTHYKTKKFITRTIPNIFILIMSLVMAACYIVYNLKN